MKQKLIIFTIAICLIFTNCDNLLDLKPHDSISVEEAFETIDDFENAIRGVYAAMRSSVYYGGNFIILPDILADNLTICTESRGTYTLEYNWFIFSNNSYITGMWYAGYSIINATNNIINQLDTENSDSFLGGTEEERNQYLGEALAVRALVHFDMVRLFGKTYTQATDSTLGIPYIKQSVVSKPSRNTVFEVYDAIIEDLTKAQKLMTTDESNRRMSSEAATALLSRVYLFKEDWENSAKAATEVIDSKRFTLADRNHLDELWTTDESDEIIFKLRFTNQDIVNGSSKIGNFFSQTGDDGTQAEFVIAYELLDLYAGGDMRVDKYTQPKEFNNKIFNVITKYFGRQEGDILYQNMNDVKILRLAEMYLNRAEANNANGTTIGASPEDDLNTLIENRYDTGHDLPDYDLTAGIDLQRRLEFAFEGHRWFDIRRKGLNIQRNSDYGDIADGSGKGCSECELEADDYRFVMPIPQSEINANANIKPQNPGYGDDVVEN